MITPPPPPPTLSHGHPQKVHKLKIYKNQRQTNSPKTRTTTDKTEQHTHARTHTYARTRTHKHTHAYTHTHTRTQARTHARTKGTNRAVCSSRGGNCTGYRSKRALITTKCLWSRPMELQTNCCCQERHFSHVAKHGQCISIQSTSSITEDISIDT